VQDEILRFCLAKYCKKEGVQLWKGSSRFFLEEILERIKRLEVAVFGMTKEEAKEFLRRCDEAVKNLSGYELDLYIEANRKGVYRAEEVLGV